jgi:hypothetical protein
MRVQRCIFTLAAAATLASSAPAYAFDAQAPEGPSIIPAAGAAQHHTTDSSDWVIGAGAAAALVVGGGVIVRRRRDGAFELSRESASGRTRVRTH